MGRGEYKQTPYASGRGVYGIARPLLGRELTDEEIREATAAGQRAVAPLVEARTKMMKTWEPSRPLTREQMEQVTQEALKVAQETEKNLVALIAKVPSHWEAIIRREGGLRSLRDALDEAPAFGVRVAQVVTPTILPDFRAWIERLLSRSENGVTVIAYVEDVLPDWLRMRRFLSGLYRAGVAAIEMIIALGKGIGSTVEALPTIAKVAAVAALVVGGTWVISKLSTTSPAASTRASR